MNWLSSATPGYNKEICDSLYQAVMSRDEETVVALLREGADPNKITSYGKTCLGLASQYGNVAILKPLIEATLTSKTENERSTRKLLHFHNQHFDSRFPCNDDSNSKCKIEEHHSCKISNSNSSFFLKNGHECCNRGYYVFNHDDEFSSGNKTHTSVSLPSTPSPLADLEWDEEVGDVAPSTKEDETCSSLYKWYANILEITGSVLASADVIPTDINQQDNITNTALHYAAEEGCDAAVQMLIDAGCKLDISSCFEMTPLLCAVLRGHVTSARLLLAAGCRVDCTTVNKLTALHHAASRGSLELVKLLVQNGAPLESRDIGERTPLFNAAHQGYHDIVRYLIAEGANVNAEEIHGFTPLCEAVWQKHPSTVRELLLGGARITHSHRLLHNAVHNGEVEILDLLAQAGGGINLHDDNGDTPLLFAARTSQPLIAEILLKNGANINSRNNLTGLVAMHVATTMIDSNTMLDEFIKVLLDHGADIDARSLFEITALHRAILLERDHAAALLIRHGADVNIIHLRDHSAKFLMRHGADIKISRNRLDMYPLEYLSLVERRRTPTLARLLVKAGHQLPRSNPSEAVPEKGTGAHYIYYASKNPLLLSDLCRIEIRQTPRKIPLYKFVSYLPLPERLKSFLMLEDEGLPSCFIQEDYSDYY